MTNKYYIQNVSLRDLKRKQNTLELETTSVLLIFLLREITCVLN